MRPFAPTAFGIDRSRFHAEIVEARLAHSGEYLRHVPVGKDAQWLVMNYQYIPVSMAGAADFQLSGANPRLWGYLDHFADKPELFREGDSARPDRGSQFEIRGFMFNAKRIDVNHVGYVSIELVQDNRCAVARPEFFTEQAALLCSTAPGCP